MRGLAALLLVLLMATPAAAERLVVELSTRVVEIASNFAGDSVTLFGVIEREGEAVSRTGPYEVAVTVIGPPQDVLVQRKERVFGIWVNTPGERFRAIPSYYGIFTSRGAADLDVVNEGPWEDPSLRWLGGYEDRAALRRAIADKREVSGLYVRDLDAVAMLTDTFFRTEIPLPSLVNDGTYQVTVVLFSDGVALDVVDTRFSIQKVGFEQRLFDVSRHQPLLYGIGAVVLALVTGYVGGVVFRRG